MECKGSTSAMPINLTENTGIVIMSAFMDWVWQKTSDLGLETVWINKVDVSNRTS